jgi:coproporphyrinogen III oxidase
MINKEEITSWFKTLQENICSQIGTVDGRNFGRDEWIREKGGGGITRVLQNGEIIEKGGVAFSAVSGTLPENIKKALNISGSEFYATGVSCIMHPVSPMIPIIHMNVRYFETSGENGPGAKWFGGGIDLTPHYVNQEDAKVFHRTLQHVCDVHDKSYYPEFKKWADDYFYIPHRKETRGIGGIFFDKLVPNEKKSIEQLFEFVKSVGESFAPLYIHIINKNRNLNFNDQHKKWQLLRRGRYVEFNLVYDKGTKFGLETDGRTESILMSLPPKAQWLYDFVPEKLSLEEETLELLRKGIDWSGTV